MIVISLENSYIKKAMKLMCLMFELNEALLIEM